MKKKEETPQENNEIWLDPETGEFSRSPDKEETLEEKVFSFLELVRSSESINMFGAAPYIMKEFNLPKNEARELLEKYLKR